MKKIILLAGLFVSGMASADVALVVNNSNSTAITKDAAAKIFIGKSKNFADGGSVTPVTLSEKSATTAEFNSKVVGKSASQIKAIWSKLVFTGKGSRPKSFASDEELMKFIAENPSAIGFVDASKVNGTVKVIATY